MLCLILASGWGSSLADDVPLPLGDFLQRPEVLGYSQPQLVVQNLCATVVIEYLVICGLLGWPERAMAKLVFWVLLVNIMTNPPAQVGAIFLGRVMGSEASAWATICMVEFAAAAVEYGLLRLIFVHMCREGALDHPITPRRTLLMVALANVASFAFGFVGLIFLLIEMGP
mgnify:FL=1